MVRLVKGAYWDTEIKRAQERGLDDYPGVHPQGDDRPQLHRLRATAAGAAAAHLPAICHPQRADGRDRSGARRRRGAASNSSACTAWARRSMRDLREDRPDARLSHLCAGRQPPRSARPIWCGGCSRTAPTPPSWRSPPMTRCRLATLLRRPADIIGSARQRAASAHPAAARSAAAAAAAIRAASNSASARRSTNSRGGRGRDRARGGGHADRWRGSDGAARPIVSPIDRTALSEPSSSRRRRRRTRPLPPRARDFCPGAGRRPSGARKSSSEPPICWNSGAAAFHRAAAARGRQDAR